MQAQMSKTEVRKAVQASGVPEAEVDKLTDLVFDREAELLKHIAPAGTMGLPKHLDGRRLQYGIPNQAFAAEAMFHWVHIWQVPILGGEQYEGSVLYKPEVVQKRDAYNAPQGIVLSAGLLARDQLASHGIELGDIVWFVRSTPWRIQCAKVAGLDQEIILVRPEEICGNRDARSRLKERETFIRYDETKQIHEYVDKDRKVWTPSMVEGTST